MSPAQATGQRRLAAVLGSLMLVMLLAALDQTIVATALPTIVGDLGGLEHLSWVVTAYLLAQTVVTPLYGKLGDLYGRKRVLQGAIVLFLVGSALCGLAQSMPELILFRAVQGLGGGGLMVGAQAALGDVVPPRQRGRYTGLFIAIFGAASVAGPLLGGFITTNLSWQWIFYINLPLGFVAFAVLAATFPSGAEGRAPLRRLPGHAAARRRADRGGAGHHPRREHARLDVAPDDPAWRRGGALALVAFALVERRAAEPILPPRLWRIRTFRVTSAVGLIIGFSLFGAVTFLPLFQQVVRGQSPTASGLQLLPLMGGLMLSSVVSGRLIARTGHYRNYPIVGTGLTVVGLLLLSTMDSGTTELMAAAFMAVLGLGLGMVMQVLILAVQNDAPYEDLGVATGGRHALPLDRRLARHRHPRRGLHQPPGQRAERPAAGRRRRGTPLGERRPGRGGRASRPGAPGLPRRLRGRPLDGLPGRRGDLAPGLRAHLAHPRGPAPHDAAG